MATFTVTTLIDENDGINAGLVSLRDAIALVPEPAESSFPERSRRRSLSGAEGNRDTSGT